MSKVRLVLLAGLLAIVSIALLGLPNYRTSLEALASDAGYIVDGSKFDLTIGSPLARGEDLVAGHGFHPYVDPWGKSEVRRTCLSHRAQEGDQIEVFVDDSWRRGTLCVHYVAQTGRITAMEWSYGPFMIDL